ncbi:hypothetical protein Ahy_B10g101891 [Arachis hypogaea]|uniref:Uncharacterized protein n=1 Tax=Arachis hypogaea TaxID=3818 RepID=A0A444X0V2_ARAHY|nr:hypothetical protein Ahy_B10g101891 [Arachis hypogaea]
MSPSADIFNPGCGENQLQLLHSLLSCHKNGVRKESKLSVKEVIALPSNTKIILSNNKKLQPIVLGSLGANCSNFSICEESWKHVNKAKKEHAYDMIKDTRHNLYHKCYKETRTFDENHKHRLKGIEEDHWKWFLEYHQKEETKVGLGRVRTLGAGPCPTQVFGNTARQSSGSGEPNEEYERRIAELTAKIEEEQVKRQSIKKQGGNLPADVATTLDDLDSIPTSSRARPSSSGNHDPQQK